MAKRHRAWFWRLIKNLFQVSTLKALVTVGAATGLNVGGLDSLTGAASAVVLGSIAAYEVTTDGTKAAKE